MNLMKMKSSRCHTVTSSKIKSSNIAAITGLFAAALISSCSGSKKLADPIPETPVATQATDPESYLNQSIDYRTFSGKTSMQLDRNGEKQNFTANLRMNRGKDIWSNVIVLGITEVARAYITTDSLKAIVRIGKKAYATSYQEGLELIQAQVEFPVLQNLFIGNPLLSGLPVQKFEVQDSLMHITVQKDDFTQVLSFHKDKRTLQQLSLTSAQRQFSCDIRYSAFAPITNQQPFAFNRSININNKGQQIRLDMEFSKAELDVPVDVSFTIPDSYERVPLKKN
jgi:hypothetical protein